MKKILSCLKNLALKLFALVLNTHGKRIVLLSTLFMQLTQLQNFNKELMSRLNETLSLASDVHALELPCYAMNTVIWGNGLSMMNSSSVDDSANYIVSLIPDWLRYPREQMIDDVKKVIQFNGTSGLPA